MARMAGVSKSSVHAQIVHCAQVELEDMTCAHKELLDTVPSGAGGYDMCTQGI